MITACAAWVGQVVPAAETTEGVLCIEFRIRMYHDGAMSKLLEKLSKVCRHRKKEEDESGEIVTSLLVVSCQYLFGDALILT